HNSGGELLHNIRKRGRLHENEARGFFRQIVSAMDYTHRNCIIHRDLKLENVMLDHENRIRIIDFGFANTFEWDKQLDTFCGSPFYAAPEMVNGIKYTGPEVDIWSMGVILFFMLCGRTPFEGENLKEIYDKISRGRFTMPPFLSSDAQHLLQQMLTVSPKMRISMKGIVEHPWTNKDCDQPIENHLPARPTVVLQPNEQSLQKMRVYKYEVEAVASALAHSDLALSPMVCIYHLVEESRRRKASRNARRSQATHMGIPGGDSSVTDVSQVSVSPHAQGSTTASPSAMGAHHDSAAAARPVSRNRYSYAPGYSHGDNHSPTSKTVNPAPSGDAYYKSSAPHSHGNNHLQVPQPHYMANKESDAGVHLESPSFGASQYGPPRLRKGSTASGQLSVGSSLNLEASSPFLRDDDRRSSRSSRFFARMRKSMPFIKARRSQIMDEVPPFDQSNTTVGNRNRVSFFQAPFRRFSAAPSALSLNNPHASRAHSYYPPSQPPPAHPQHQSHNLQMPPQQQQQQQAYQRSQGNRPATANVENRPSMATGQRPSTSSGPHHRYTDFGPAQKSPSSRVAANDGGERHRKSEPLRDLPFDAKNGGPEQPPVKRAARPLSVVSNRQITPLRLHPAQSYQGNQTNAPFTQQKAGVPLPAALTSRGSAPSGVGSGQSAYGQNNGGNSASNKAGGVRGIFNLRCTMLGPLAEIHVKVERALKKRAIVLRKMTEVLYSCEDRGLRFEILIEHVQGHLHTIKFKRLEGSWWAYKKLTVAVTDDIQSGEVMVR
ncbi:hypothetical protein IWW38_003661, partial [Coemansia aciculifera]